MLRCWLVVALVSVAHATPRLAPSVSYGGLLFGDPACRAAFATPGEITGARLTSFAACLATLDLQPSDRREALDDLELYTAAPGFEIEAHVVDGQLAAIGYLVSGVAGEPTITPAALEQLRITGRSALPHGHAWATICLDDVGRVVRSEIRSASSPAVARAAASLVATWDFGPFRIAGRATPVCAFAALGRGTDTLPIANGDRLEIAGSELERIAGERHISPSDPDKVQIMRNGWSRVEPVVELCIDADGAVDDVDLLHSSGVAGYDSKVVFEVRQWRYRPYLDRETAVPVCTTAHFVYRQL